MEKKMNYLCIEETNAKYGLETANERYIISSLLNQLGIPRNTNGYKYLLHVILKINQMEDVNVKLTTELYPQIAEELHSSTYKIERSLRYSIAVAWNRNRKGIKGILGYCDDYKPYSSEFIWLVADKYRLLKERNEITFKV
jgi:two-component system response regulator (stage 0 sporulation protein A)